jgi:hypothetical protein
MKLTANEKDVLLAMAATNYASVDVSNDEALRAEGINTWFFDVADNTSVAPKSLGGVVSSLVKKGLVKVSGSGTEDDECTIRTTKAGVEAIIAIRNGTEAEVAAPVAKAKPALGAKQFIRAHALDGKFVLAEGVAAGYTLGSLRTAISDLKNAKYAGKEGVLVVEGTQGGCTDDHGLNNACALCAL